MFYFKKYIQLPGPKDLGMSDSNNAMASELFRNNSTEATWEQYEERIKKEYPVKFFLASTVPSFFRDLWNDVTRKPKDFYYWFKCTFIPAHQYHLIDIREPKTNPLAYRYGWIDSDTKMVMAMFKILCDFVEKEMVGRYVPSEEDAAKDDGVDYQYHGLKRQLADHKEYMAIYNYWKVDRLVLDDNASKAIGLWSVAHRKSKGDKSQKLTRLWNKSRRADKIKNKKLEEMLHRLINIRTCLWT